MAAFSVLCAVFIAVGLWRWRPEAPAVTSSPLEERRRRERTDPVWGWRKRWPS
jgi:hypothetical protein